MRTVNTADLAGPLTAREVATLHSVCLNTVARWIAVGVNGVRLQAYRAGHCFRVHPDALAAFLAHCNPAAEVPPPRTPTRQMRQALKDQEALRAALRRH
jgi:hypothetical protein